MSPELAALQFKFDNFRDLPAEVDDKVCSEIQTDCNGNKWRLVLLPGGRSDSAEEGFIGAYLWCEYKQLSDSDSNHQFDACFSIFVKDINGTMIALNGEEGDGSSEKFEYTFVRRKWWSGTGMLIERSKVLDEANNLLKNGALTIYVTIQIKVPEEEMYKPKCDRVLKMLHLLESGTNADVSFMVKGQIVRAHSLIIDVHAPLLSSFYNQQSKASAVIIEDTDPEVFCHILKYIYAGIIPSKEEIFKWNEELINAANKFSLVELKIAVENCMVRECFVDIENVSRCILFADAQSCPLLKEYAIRYFLLHKSVVLTSEHSKELRESAELLAEIILLMDSRDEESMTVTELRKELGKLELDVDGSKRVLVERLNSARRQRTE